LQPTEQFDRMGMNSGRRQPVADHDRDVAWAALSAVEKIDRGLVKPSAEIRPLEVILAVTGAACDGNSLATERTEGGKEARYVEGGTHGIAGARMVEGEVEQRPRRQARAGAAQRHARRRQFAQIIDRPERRLFH
jgi:hypothetical protein